MTSPRAGRTAVVPAEPDRPRRRRYLWWVLLPVLALTALTVAVLAVRLTPLPGDTVLTELAREHRPAAVVGALRAVTATGTSFTPYLLAVVAGLVLAGRPAVSGSAGAAIRAAATVSFCLGWLILGQAIRFGFMTVLARPRPPAEDWLTHASRYAYPSGHAATSAMAAGLIVIALVVRRTSSRRWWILLAVCWAAAVGASRVWLGVHWASDVIAGWMLALSWTALGFAPATRITVAESRTAR